MQVIESSVRQGVALGDLGVLVCSPTVPAICMLPCMYTGAMQPSSLLTFSISFQGPPPFTASALLRPWPLLSSCNPQTSLLTTNLVHKLYFATQKLSRSFYSKLFIVDLQNFVFMIETVHVINHSVKIASAKNQLKLGSFSHQIVKNRWTELVKELIDCLCIYYTRLTKRP